MGNCAINDCHKREYLALLREARRYVSDAGSDEDPETQSNSAALLKEIDAALAE